MQTSDSRLDVILLTVLVLLGVAPEARSDDYTLSCWLNGWRKNPTDLRSDVFAIQTNRYAFTLDVANFLESSMGLIAGASSYEQALVTKTQSLRTLPKVDLKIEIEVDGRRYQARSCQAGTAKSPKPLSSVLLWESGRFVQHYEFLGLNWLDSHGERWEGEASLDVVAWSDSLTFNVRVAGGADCEIGVLRLSLDGELGQWGKERRIPSEKGKLTAEVVSLTCNFNGTISRNQNDHDAIANDAFAIGAATVDVESVQGQPFPTQFKPELNCLVTDVNRLERSFEIGYTDIRRYDEFRVKVTGNGDASVVPYLLHMRGPANVTGVCAILCEEDGTPTGIPIQMSKNWHQATMGSYLMAYARLPVSEPKTYLLRLAYGFYGTLPSASHAQLSLVGYSDRGGNGRWDQFAIGCWGETICFDIDRSLVDAAITDVRLLMARDGREGRKWGWTEAGWGGDWLHLRTQEQSKFFPNQWKSAYLSHGPCLTDIQHSGTFGANREVDSRARIQVARSDDYSRTHQRLSYHFNQDVKAEEISWFRLGGSHHYWTPQIAFGNAKGLIQQIDTPPTMKPKEVFLDATEITGPSPHWFAFPGAKSIAGPGDANQTLPSGYRALVIRRYQAEINGVTYTNPTIESVVHRGNPANLTIELVPPKGITRFRKGDRVDLDVELIALPREADDYYGPNEAFRRHLTEFPNSWRTTYREAIGNDLEIEVDGGEAIRSFPIQIRVTEPIVNVGIKGGVGFIPIRFEGLHRPDRFRLDQIVDNQSIPLNQSVHGNDFWQTDYDAVTRTYQVSFNLPTDESGSSQWVLITDAP